MPGPGKTLSPFPPKNSTIWRKNAASPLLLSKFDYSTAIKFLQSKNSDTFEQNSGISPLSGNSDKMGGGDPYPGQLARVTRQVEPKNIY